jgi:hypothetical protein
MQNNNTNEYWWRNFPAFTLRAGYSYPRTKSPSRVPTNFWKSAEFSAWTYELVRRLPWFARVKADVSANDLAFIRTLGPYPEAGHLLHFRLKRAVTGPASVRLNTGKFPRNKDYTNPLPPLVFNRRVMSKKAILDFLGRWLDADDQRTGFSSPMRSKGKSRNKDQSYKLMNWTWVELADRSKAPTRPFTHSEQKIRSKAKAHALKYYQCVIRAAKLAQTGLTFLPFDLPVLPETIGNSRKISDQEFRELLAKVLSQSRTK